MCAAFKWKVPARYNIGVDACDRHAEATPSAVALIFEREDGSVQRYSFADIKRLSNRLANALAAHGLARGDRVGILLQQSPETAIAHIAAYKSALIAIPLFVLFGEEALEYRLGNSGAKALVTDTANLSQDLSRSATSCRSCASSSSSTARASPARSISQHSSKNPPTRSRPSTPRRTIPPSSSTPPAPPARPRVPCTPIACCSAICPASNSRKTCSPSRATCSGRPPTGPGSADFLMCSTRLASRHPRARTALCKFETDAAFALMRRHNVRNAFLPPTALKLMRQSGAPANHGVTIRSIGRRRRDARPRAPRLGPRHVRRHDQRILRPDRMQSRRRQLRRADAGPSRRHGPRHSRPHGRNRRSRRQ